jgi:hypothetical protein
MPGYRCARVSPPDSALDAVRQSLTPHLQNPIINRVLVALSLWIRPVVSTKPVGLKPERPNTEIEYVPANKRCSGVEWNAGKTQGYGKARTARPDELNKILNQ